MSPIRSRLGRRLWLLLGIIGFAVVIAWTAMAQEQTPDPAAQRQGAIALYQQSCGSCHVALPPEVMPLQSWQRILPDPNHYGQTITAPAGPTLQLIWSFLREGSRSLSQTETVPYRLKDSRYFRALHPQVDFSTPLRVTSCIDCHTQANRGDFITLKPTGSS